MLRALLTDVDGTITDSGPLPTHRCHRGNHDRSFTGGGVVLASGNTACFMDALCRMIGTIRDLHAREWGCIPDWISRPTPHQGRPASLSRGIGNAFRLITRYGDTPRAPQPSSHRYADVAFSRTVPPEEVEKILVASGKVIDTGFAIHLQSNGINKGTAWKHCAQEMDLSLRFLAIGDCNERCRDAQKPQE